MKILFYTTLFLLTSCANLLSGQNYLKNSSILYKQVEESGEFSSERKTGFNKDKRYVVKNKVFDHLDPRKVFEKSISISKLGKLGELKAIMPLRAETMIVLNGEDYITKHTYEHSKRKLIVDMISPERQWNGRKDFNLPKEAKVVCFYSMIVECAGVTGFFEKAMRNSGGVMNFYLIWDAYPYFQEQFLNIPNRPFDRVSLEYEGLTSDGNMKVRLNAGGQMQIFIINKKLLIDKLLWPAQGFSKNRL